MGLFDFNGDGKTSFMERVMAYNIYKASRKKEDTHDNFWSYGGRIDYSWRDDCENGEEYGISPENYENQWDYEMALEDAKSMWQDFCAEGAEYGLDAEDFETLEEYMDALVEARCEMYEKMQAEEEDTSSEITVSFEFEEVSDDSNKVKTPEIQRESHAPEKTCVHNDELENVLKDKNIYYYCSVLYENNPFPYHYRVNNLSLNIGDKVVVPVGSENKEVIAEVVSVEQHTRVSVPYPIEECKFVIRKYDEFEDDK